MASVDVPDIDRLLKLDPYLETFQGEIRRRYGCFQKYLDGINENEGGIDKFTKGYQHFGIHVTPDNGIYCKEWAPGALQLYLMGDFSTNKVLN